MVKFLRQLGLSRPGSRQQLLETSDERDGFQLRLLQTWREGFFFGASSCSGDYEAGFMDGFMAYKRTEHAHVRQLELELARWQGRREDFGKPRDGDFPGLQAG